MEPTGPSMTSASLPIPPTTDEQTIKCSEMASNTSDESGVKSVITPTIEGVAGDKGLQDAKIYDAELEKADVNLTVAAQVTGVPAPVINQSVNTTGPRIPYNTGYGDFSFGRMIDSASNTFKPYDRQQVMMGSNGLPFVEIGSFERSGPFPFFKFPRELRNKVFELMLEPFYVYDEKLKKRCIQVSLQAPGQTRKSDLWAEGMTFASHLKLRNRLNYFVCPLVPAVISLEELDKIESDFYKIQKQNAQIKERHPTRTQSYHLHVSAPKPATPQFPGRVEVDWLFKEWIRGASNTSPQFRLELLEVFWSAVELRALRGAEFACLPKLLLDRPALQTKVKYLRLNVNVNRLAPYHDDRDYMEESFEELCEFASKVLDLESLTVKIFLLAEDLESRSVDEVREELAHLRAWNKITVNKVPNVMFSIDPFGIKEDWNEEKVDACCERVWSKYGPTLLELLLPDKLRVGGMISQERIDTYFQYGSRIKFEFPFYSCLS